jgi:hypothetical protein
MPAIALTVTRAVAHSAAAAAAASPHAAAAAGEAALELLFGSPGPWAESPGPGGPDGPGGPYLCPVYGTQLRGGAVMAVPLAAGGGGAERWGLCAAALLLDPYRP